MNNFRYKIMRFLSGRYGPDALFYLLFAVAAVLAIVNSFVRNAYLQLIIYAIVIVALLRMFSRNCAAREKENSAFWGLFERFKKKRDFENQKRNDKTHIYKKCPYCKAMLRLPRRKGKHKTICPKCLCEFSVRVYKE